MSGEKFKVGQRVWIYNRNMRGEPLQGVVTKVGRKLVTVKGNHVEQQYRMTDGQGARDDFSWIKTEAQRAEHDRRGALVTELRELGIDLNWRARLTAEQLERIRLAVGGEQ